MATKPARKRVRKPRDFRTKVGTVGRCWTYRGQRIVDVYSASLSSGLTPQQCRDFARWLERAAVWCEDAPG